LSNKEVAKSVVRSCNFLSLEDKLLEHGK
jgi:hypothetical protein